MTRRQIEVVPRKARHALSSSWGRSGRFLLRRAYARAAERSAAYGIHVESGESDERDGANNWNGGGAVLRRAAQTLRRGGDGAGDPGVLARARRLRLRAGRRGADLRD